MSTRSDRPAAATRCRASRCCSADSVTERTCAPRAAARMHSSPQPVPISSTRLPGPTRAESSSRSILRRCAVGQLVASGRGQRRRTARWSRSWSRRGTRRTARSTGRSARRCCAGPVRAVVLRTGLADNGDRPQSAAARAAPGRPPSWRTRSARRPDRRTSTRRPCRTRRSRSGRIGRPGGPARRAGGSPWSAASDRRRRPPSRRGRPAAAAGARRRAAAAGRRPPPRPSLSGPAGTRATSGQRSESIAC